VLILFITFHDMESERFIGQISIYSTWLEQSSSLVPALPILNELFETSFGMFAMTLIARPPNTPTCF
jgi:hypothetical protein